jgi:hypothetical protein
MLKHQKVKIIRWSDIKWKDIEIHVLRLQESIFVAKKHSVSKTYYHYTSE